MRLPRVVEELVESFERLPGVGHKTAQRLAFYLLRVPQRDLDRFARSLSQLKKETHLCQTCHNLTEHQTCDICNDSGRDHSKICIVESFQDVIALEKARVYNGVYHVLHGAISPLNNIGPEELFMEDLFTRLKDGKISEIILATNTSLEGEATAMYIADKIKEMKLNLKVTRIGRGLPTGVELEYADDDTLINALNGRSEI